ncbi:hypothetical protein IL306_011661 [Fusarium sp. DS 682]|nr:hypothetical protein IL306_011661 [Fusarium sp. DS 682]
MPLHALKTEWSMGENRQVDWKHVQKLCEIFKKGGVKRRARENRILVLSDREDVSKMKRHMGLDEDAQVSPERELLSFEDWSSVHEDKQVEVMVGQHRIKALETYVLQMRMETRELWWTCDFYDRHTLPDRLNLQLRVNRRDPVMVDSHGQIWAQVVAASSKNDKLLREDKTDILKGEITEALHLSSDIYFPVSRLVTIWRNERWRDMTSRWCETTVGRDTFKISTWNRVENEGGSVYAKRFADEGWLGLLRIVRQYVGDEFREQWTASSSSRSRGAEELTDVESRRAALGRARDLSSFLKGISEFSQSTILDSAAGWGIYLHLSTDTQGR